MGKINFKIFQIQEKIKNFAVITISECTHIYDHFIKQWSMLHTNLDAAGFLLDPEFVNMAHNTNEEATNGFYEFIGQVFPDTALQVQITSYLAKFRSSQGIFASDVAPVATSTMPARQWRSKFSASSPYLQNLAVSVLSQTTSSSEAGRNWSLFNFVQGKKRCRLNLSTVDKLVDIPANTRLPDKSHSC
jgi:hypothetical protein